MQRLRDYFLRHRIPAEMTIAAKRYLDSNIVGQEQGVFDELALLQPLPLQMQKRLQMQAREPIVGKHHLIVWLKKEHLTVLRDLCHSGFTVNYWRAFHSIFIAGDACECMLFVESGSCLYIRPDIKQGRMSRDDVWASELPIYYSSSLPERTGKSRTLTRSQWICEPALWINGWQTQGSCITSVASRLLRLDSESLLETVARFPQVHFDIVLYARWVLASVPLSEGMADLWSPSFAPYWSERSPSSSFPPIRKSSNASR